MADAALHRRRFLLAAAAVGAAPVISPWGPRDFRVGPT